MAILEGTHIIHTVQHGDTLYSLAVRYESDVDLIVKANALYPPFTENYLIYPGSQLVIPKKDLDRSVTLYAIVQGETLYSIGRLIHARADLLAGMNDTIQNPHFVYPFQQVIIPAVIYEIEEGDSLSSIAGSLGVSLQTILNANRYRMSISPDLIYEGTHLIVPTPSSKNIVVFEPRPGSLFSDGSLITGLARAFEANVLYSVKDDTDRIISRERYTTAALAGPAYGPFMVSVPFDERPRSETGELWVYTRSAKDGEINDLVKVKVRFSGN
ncbi:LysM peptidoglycan-binding domain-containing protein [Alteribacter aurantiacus]|uniref:LysM peptidoglycan-binding domain-containing protein n=1 Tax=Alteribacter aurantiacus TaxID=254410 RepID=UPI000415F1DB|nr:LysM peptidoglycan-binding domain-containing protein [Alteribacter aurantiacus]